MNSIRNATSTEIMGMRDQALAWWLPKLKHYASCLRLLESALPVRRPHLESLADPPAPVGCSTSHEHLRQSIESRIAEIGRLVGEGEKPVEATRHLADLANALIFAQLGIFSKVKLVSTETAGGLTNRAPLETSGIYEPDALLRLGHLFDKAVLALTPNLRTQANKAEIAKLILGRASESKAEQCLFIRLVIAIVAAAEGM
nr:hypothetical protein BDOA9_0203790 [Bradyrhizobium sp. DOA9]